MEFYFPSIAAIGFFCESSQKLSDSLRAIRKANHIYTVTHVNAVLER